MYQLVCPDPPAADLTCAVGWVVTEVEPAMTQADFELVVGSVAFIFGLAAVFKMILRMMKI